MLKQRHAKIKKKNLLDVSESVLLANTQIRQKLLLNQQKNIMILKLLFESENRTTARKTSLAIVQSLFNANDKSSIYLFYLNFYLFIFTEENPKWPNPMKIVTNQSQNTSIKNT